VVVGEGKGSLLLDGAPVLVVDFLVLQQVALVLRLLKPPKSLAEATPEPEKRGLHSPRADVDIGFRDVIPRPGFISFRVVSLCGRHWQ
jgi:hypothetical protein